MYSSAIVNSPGVALSEMRLRLLCRLGILFSEELDNFVDLLAGQELCSS
jgi:hypothetical protein